MSEIRIGISGWRYGPWRKDFYPTGLRQDDELAFASRAVNSIEINGSFYALQTPERYRNWHDQTPEGFVFSVKAPRYITHVRRLKEIEQPLANFFASGPLLLGDKLGPILWQFPPSLRYDEASFSHFLELLPHRRKAARACAEQCSEQLKGNGATALKGDGALRHAVEIRHDSFCCTAFVELLRRHNVALVVADSAGKWPYVEDVTADFVYLRLHGDVELYSSGYTARALRRWQARIEAWSRGGQPDDAQLVVQRAPRKRASRDVYCYFDNDQKVHAPYDARRLLERLKLDGELLTEPGVEPEVEL
ncbi:MULTISPECIES: DUF72 domain-containing protein [Pseudomonas]|uniref:DUF72 domain-containing protein n=1 Tax=Pseudomonas guariconensis TaxID=1288410 RepID=UPI002096CE86|nr:MULTISPECIES: DUF72 domain-containing protein [Pseudomonas]MCO7593788.1 DUF72 domain-containing protein [Pseudomonas guariconensis]MCU7219605.1 DUF72 domain-containing protein [Pseudomonas brassicacearum]